MKYGVYIGRFSPFHMGHYDILRQMGAYVEKSLVLIGSCSSPLSKSLYFTYHQRKNLITACMGEVSVCGIPDYKDVDPDPEFRQWHENLWDIIRLKWPDACLKNTIFFGGSERDLIWARMQAYSICVIDRNKTKISGTMVREKLDKGEDISEYVHPATLDLILYYYNINKKFIN